MASVELHAVRKSFGPLEVIHGVDLVIEDGEFIVLVGPSGCGKSTLLRMIAGLETMSSGDVLIGGKVVNKLNPGERDIAMVFQNYALYPHMNVAQNMSFNLRLAGRPKKEITERINEAARMLGLTDLLNRRPGQLSGGQRQRVAMGRAVVRNPAVFLFDEPLSNLDAKLRVQMRAEIKALHRNVKATSIYVTHDQIEAMTLADRVVILNQGKIEQLGTPLELYRQPANMFAAGFIGSPAMNFLEGTIVSSSEGIAARLSDGTAFPVTIDSALADGRQVIIGLRPEHLMVGEEGAPLRGVTKLVEPTGAQTHVSFSIAGHDIMVLVDGALDVQTGMAFSVTIAPELVHVFDKTTQTRLN